MTVDFIDAKLYNKDKIRQEDNTTIKQEVNKMKYPIGTNFYGWNLKEQVILGYMNFKGQEETGLVGALNGIRSSLTKYTSQAGLFC